MDGVHLGGGGGGRELGRGIYRKKEKINTKKILKIFTKGAVTTEAENLFQYFTTLTEKADPFPRRCLVPCRSAL